MTYLVLARKWRPQQLADILGQEHVTRTLSNALSSGRIAHAFLFTGARGVGKTSAARILAKALCCESTGAPTATPCGECSACAEIAEGRATDVFEIDAASNNGVANVREIIDNVRYLPGKTRFKIYIVDEVHMLSTGAFNALLKTLEEPPSHVKFILATTDVHKVPVTILSRCQRYDFRRIPIARIAERLSSILKSEGFDHDPTAMTLVARESEGSMRDAQSLLEQVLTFADGRRLDAELVRSALGVADRAVLGGIVDAIAGREPGRTLELVKEIHDRGVDMKKFGDALVEYVRDVLVARLLDDPASVLDRPSDEVAQLVARARKIEAATLERIFGQLCKIVEEVGESAFPRYTLEVGLASLAEAPPRIALEALVQKIDQLQSVLDRRPPVAAPGGAAAQARPFHSRPVEREAPAPAPPTPPSNGTHSSPPPWPDDDDAPWPEDARPAPSTPVAAAPSTPVALDFSGFVALVRSKRPTLSGSLAHVRPVKFTPGEVILGCDTSFDADALGNPDTARYLSGLLENAFGVPTKLSVTRTEPQAPEAGAAPAEKPQTLVEIEESARDARRQDKAREARKSPAVKAITEELRARIARVRVIDEGER